MVSAKDFVDRFRDYLVSLGYGDRTINASNDGSLRFMDVDFGFRVDVKKQGARVSVFVEGRDVLRGLDARISEIEDGSFWEKCLSPEAVDMMRKYNSFLRDVRIKREEDKYVFQGVFDAGNLGSVFMAVFNYFIRPSLYCAREGK